MTFKHGIKKQRDPVEVHRLRCDRQLHETPNPTVTETPNPTVTGTPNPTVTGNPQPYSDRKLHTL